MLLTPSNDKKRIKFLPNHTKNFWGAKKYNKYIWLANTVNFKLKIKIFEYEIELPIPKPNKKLHFKRFKFCKN